MSVIPTKAVTANVNLHIGQLRALESRAPVTLVVGGIRAGKTHGGALITILRALDQPCRIDECHAVGSPTYPMSAVPVEKIFSLLYDKDIFPVCPLIKYYKRDRVFLLRCRRGGTTKIHIFSMHEPNRLRGFKILSFWYDEGAYGSEESWRIAQGRVADTNGPVLVTTTPAGYNWVYGIYEKAVEEKRRGVPLHKRVHRVIHFTSLQNTFIENWDGFNRLLASYDEQTYNQEVLARFVKASGLVYYTFSRNRNLVKRPWNPSQPVWVGQDFNVSKMASAIGQPFTTVDGSPGFHVHYERLAPNSDTFGLIRFLEKFCTEHGIQNRKLIKIVPDASSKARSTSGRSDFYLLREAGFDVDAPASNPFVRDRVMTMNSLIAPRGSSFAQLTWDPRCVQSIEALEKQSYDGSDPPMPDKTLGFDHIMDATGYVCWRKLPLRGSMSLGGVPQTRYNNLPNQKVA